MTTQLPLQQTIAAYIGATNNHDASAFIGCFAESAVVNDAGREFRGIAAIKEWSDREIIDARVTLEVRNVADRGGQTVVTTKVDGNFDKTGLPDPLLLDHQFKVVADKIAQLTIRLVDGKPAP